jgi:hypothetical protein
VVGHPFTQPKFLRTLIATIRVPKRCGAQLREMFVLCPERISDLSAAVPVAATVDGMTLNRGIRRGRCLDMLLYHDVDASKLGPRVMIDIYSIK